MSSRDTLHLISRRSALAVAQTDLVRAALRGAAPKMDVLIKYVDALGDERRDREQLPVRDKREWIVGLEDAVVAGEADGAVHSAKDVPVEVHADTVLIPILEREDPRDVFVGRTGEVQGNVFESFPKGGRVGTCSLRRRAQLLKIRCDLVIEELRGNVGTRLEKLDRGDQVSGIVLAAAGLKRLGYQERASHYFSPEEMMPAVNQGILVAQCRKSDTDLQQIFSKLSAASLRHVWEAERAVVRILQADCHSCVSVYGVVDGAKLNLSARVLSSDGKECLEETAQDNQEKDRALGELIAERLLRRGAAALLKGVAK